MSFTLVPDSENASANITVIGAGDSAAATAEGIVAQDGDTTRVRFDAIDAFMDVRLSTTPGTPAATLKLSVWVVARRGGLLLSDPDTGEPRYPSLHVEVRCFDSGRVIDVGTIRPSSSSYQTFVLPLENDIDPGVDGWEKLAVVITRTDNEPGNVFCTAIEFRALEPGAIRTRAAVTRQPMVASAGARSMSAGKVVGHAR